MSFDLYNCSFKIQESIKIPTPSLGSVGVMWMSLGCRGILKDYFYTS
jgi:hypothetical protein